MKIKFISLLILLVLIVMPLTVVFAQDPQPPVPAGEDGTIPSVTDLLTDGDLKRVGIVLFLVFGNWLAAVLVAISSGTFDAKKLPEFFVKTAIPFIGGLIIFEAALHVLAPSAILAAFGKEFSAQFNAGFDASFLWITFGSILTSVGRSFVGNISALFRVIADGSKALAAKATPGKS